MPASSDLQRRSAIVTGAGKGLGRAYALHLASRGASVLVNNRRHAGEADAQTSAMQTVNAIRAAGGVAEANWSDVRDPDSGEAMVQQAHAHFGRLDIVVANAGVDKASSFQKQSMADFRQIFDIGFFGNLHLAHAAWPYLVKQSYGRVILTASSAGLYGNYGQAAYSAAKAAVIGLMRALAVEGQRNGIRVNVIAPYGYSQMTAPYMTGDMARLFDPAYVAPLVGWLAGESCDVSGEVLVSGAGLLRRAGIGETGARLQEQDGIADAVHALQTQALNSYATANDSFARLVQEHSTLVKDESTP
ncbi:MULTISPECIES: SDR family NAD(P)-dependent oxidoreductase [Polaromonas]|uniref:SDR family NAD(P)-dependent oxidoreductase n=1 Tax=Polaromonas aquatica TaxID=332657 RepID=A0ABW1TX98_9BURK